MYSFLVVSLLSLGGVQRAVMINDTTIIITKIKNITFSPFRFLFNT